MKKFLFLLLLSIFVISCDKEEVMPTTEEEDIKIKEYLAKNNIEATKHASGMYYKITEQGTGSLAVGYRYVEVKYKGYLLNGTVFDESTKPVKFDLSSLIYGWRVGIPMLREGGKAMFFIPSYMGYGSQEQTNIPKYSILIFELELVDFYN